MNGQTFSQNPRKRGKSHLHLHARLTVSQTGVLGGISLGQQLLFDLGDQQSLSIAYINGAMHCQTSVRHTSPQCYVLIRMTIAIQSARVTV